MLWVCRCSSTDSFAFPIELIMFGRRLNAQQDVHRTLYASGESIFVIFLFPFVDVWHDEFIHSIEWFGVADNKYSRSVSLLPPVTSLKCHFRTDTSSREKKCRKFFCRQRPFEMDAQCLLLGWFSMWKLRFTFEIGFYRNGHDIPFWCSPTNVAHVILHVARNMLAKIEKCYVEEKKSVRIVVESANTTTNGRSIKIRNMLNGLRRSNV